MEFEIKLNDQDAQIVLQALGELPLKASLNAFLKINGQLVKQQNPETPARSD